MVDMILDSRMTTDALTVPVSLCATARHPLAVVRCLDSMEELLKGCLLQMTVVNGQGETRENTTIESCGPLHETLAVRLSDHSLLGTLEMLETPGTSESEATSHLLIWKHRGCIQTRPCLRTIHRIGATFPRQTAINFQTVLTVHHCVRHRLRRPRRMMDPW